MGLLLGLAGAAAAVLGVAAARRPVRWIFGASVGLGAIAIVGSVVLALGKMADANGIHHSGPWQTSYASGAVLGVLASFVILVAASIGLTSGR